MPLAPVRAPHRLAADEPAANSVALLPTVVVGSFKGGVWKTSIAVALAERLAFAGLRVLLMTTDPQEDARPRLGVQPRDPDGTRVVRGAGSITVLGVRGSKAADVLYRTGPGKLGPVDVVVVDTAPVETGGSLPGVLLFATTDGDDASRNLISMLRQTPKNTAIVLVRVHRQDPDEWTNDANAIAEASGKMASMKYLPEPLPIAAPVKAALGAGRSVWALPRRGCTLEFLNGVEIMATLTWQKIHPGKPIPTMPAAATSAAYIEGWDNDDA